LARKTANVVLNLTYNVPSGVIVDTHVARRLGLVPEEKPGRIEAGWIAFGPALVLQTPGSGACLLPGGCAKIGIE